jgi:hypothetical protein
MQIKQTVKRAEESIERFRQRVGGDIYLFLCSMILLLNGLILAAAGIYMIFTRDWKHGFAVLLVGAGATILARVFFLLSHWFKRLIDRLFEKLWGK